MNLEMSTQTDGDTLIVTLTGELTRANIDAFKATALEHFENDNYHVAVQCENLSYIDSAGLGAFIYVRKIVIDRDRQFYLTAVNGWLKSWTIVAVISPIAASRVACASSARSSHRS